MVFVSLFIGISPAIAQSPPEENRPTAQNASGSGFGALRRTGTARVDRVIDALTVTMKDGKIVRLSGLDVPDAGTPEDELSLRAFEALKTLLPEGTEVALYQTRNAKAGRTNRMGQQLAHLTLDKDAIWVQGALLSLGLARAMPEGNDDAMAAQMLALENAARGQGMGLWEGADGPHAVLAPDALDHKTGTVQIVEGTVLRAATVRNRLYLNFGSDWRTDFTVTIEPALRRALAKAGIDPMALSGKRIRVRGHIQSNNGPAITLENIHHLEVIEAPLDRAPANG